VLAGAAAGSIQVVAVGVAGAVLAWSALSGTALVKARVPAGVSHPARFRAVVALLHVLQPHARFWGRLRTRPLRSPGPQAPVWSGDRMAFIDQVAGAAQRSRWQVRYAGETDAHDLVARRRFTTAKLNLAVVWDWTPQWAIRVRPRFSAAVAGTVGVLVAGAAAPRLVLAAAASAVLVAAGDLAWSQRALRIQVARIAARSEVVDGGSAAPETTAVPAALPVEA